MSSKQRTTLEKLVAQIFNKETRQRLEVVGKNQHRMNKASLKLCVGE